MGLRQRLVRLAYQQPELRPHLLPLLRQAAREVVVDAPPFKVSFATSHVSKQEQVLDALKKAERAFQKAGIRLKAPVNVLVKGRGSAQRATYHPRGYIRLVPRTLRGPTFKTVIHELGHYLHDQQVPGGFKNLKILHKYWDVLEQERGQGPRQLEDTTKLTAALAALKRQRAKLGKGLLRKGVTFKYKGRAGFSYGSGPYVREYKIVRARGKEILVEILNPSDWDKQTRPGPPYFDTFPRDFVMEHVSPDLKQEKERLDKEIEELKKQLYDAAVAQQETLYEDLHSDWIPTDYSRTNHKEWFAELVTAMVLRPGAVPDYVKKWVKRQVK